MKPNIKRLTVASICVSVICVMSMLSVNFGGISFSLALLAVVLTGLLLPPSYAFASCVVYIAIGAVGIPVFANFCGGLGVLFGQSGGYIISYPFVALIISLFVQNRDLSLKSLLPAIGISLLICYAFGTSWFMIVTDVSLLTAFIYCVLPFVPIDICKCVVACIIAQRLNKIIKVRL